MYVLVIIFCTAYFTIYFDFSVRVGECLSVWTLSNTHHVRWLEGLIYLLLFETRKIPENTINLVSHPSWRPARGSADNSCGEILRYATRTLLALDFYNFMSRISNLETLFSQRYKQMRRMTKIPVRNVYGRKKTGRRKYYSTQHENVKIK